MFDFYMYARDESIWTVLHVIKVLPCGLLFDF